MSRFTLSRRLVLRGLAGGMGAAVAVPILDAMCNGNGTAFADGTALPTFFGVYYWGNGVRLSKWVPGATGSGAAWSLSDSLSPYAAVKEYLSVVSGTVINLSIDQHSQGAANILSGMPRVDVQGPKATQGGPTIDQVVAKAIGKDSPFKSIEVGIQKRVYTDEGTVVRYLSHNGPYSFNPPEYSPQALFDRLFGKQGGTAIKDPRSPFRKSLLDAVLADATRLQARLGAADRARLDQHLEGVRSLEKRLADAPADKATAACMSPAAPGATPAQIEAQSQVMSKLISLALACGQTRVFSVMFSSPLDPNNYGSVGQSGDYHATTHDEGGDQPTVQKVVQLIQKNCAILLQALRDTPIGSVNALHQAAILITTDVNEGARHQGDNWPILVAGRAGGRLKSDLHYRSNREFTLKVHLSVLKALGLPVDSFGVSDRLRVTEPLGPLMA